MSVKRVSSTAVTAIAMAAPKDGVAEKTCQKPILAVQRAKLAAKLPSSCCFDTIFAVSSQKVLKLLKEHEDPSQVCLKKRDDRPIPGITPDVFLAHAS